MEQLVFEGMPEPLAREPDRRSARRKLTARQKALIAQGYNPATKRRFLQPVGEQACKDCSHCIGLGTNTRTYYKCDLVFVTRGMATDIRLKWPACARFEPKERVPE